MDHRVERNVRRRDGEATVGQQHFAGWKNETNIARHARAGQRRRQHREQRWNHAGTFADRAQIKRQRQALNR